MASEVVGLPNGNYAPHHAYGSMEQNGHAYANNNHASQHAAAQPPPPSSSTPSNAPAATTPSTTAASAQSQTQQDIPKDEVGWYFVEQYYTTLSRNPEQLFLFYNKRSQYVSGQETDKVAVCVGQRAINDKIRDLDFHDCKVRVTNVDSQASDTNIVIQVIGELSNRAQPHKKFTQTFVLATQTNGYFVLNDIFRFLVDEEDEPEAEIQQPAEETQQVSGTESNQEPAKVEPEPKTLTSSTDPAAIERDANEVDKKVEEKLVHARPAEDTTIAAVNGGSTAEEEAKEEEAVVEATPSEPEPEQASVPTITSPQLSTTEADIEPEKPKDPEPSPAVEPAKAVIPQQTSAPKPAAAAVPKTWASLAASANRAAIPSAPQASAPAPAPKTAPAPKATATTTPSQPSTPSAAPAPSASGVQSQDAPSSDSQDEWTAVGGSHNRQQSKQANNVAQPEPQQYRGYIKNVLDHVDTGALRAQLEKFGEIVYLDVARQKNCAFVDFKTPEGYQKATSGPFKIGDDELYVEERRIRPGSTPYVPRGQFQGGRGGTRGGSSQGTPRGSFQGNNARGNAAARGRGGSPGQRGGRGGAPA